MATVTASVTRGYLQQLRDNHQLTVFAFDYRGYGKSEGSPGEQGILEDSHAAQMWLAKRPGFKPADIVLMGRSLGGGVAVDLAAETWCPRAHPAKHVHIAPRCRRLLCIPGPPCGC